MTSISSHVEACDIARSIDQVVMATPVAAEYVGFSVDSLKHWRLRGKGPRFVRVGARVLYRIADLDAWLADHVVSE